MKTTLEKWTWLIKLLIVLAVGGSLYFWATSLRLLYPSLAIAAFIHIVEEATRWLLRRSKFWKRSHHIMKKVGFLSLAVPFSLYAYFVMQLWGGLSIICILMLGGLLDVIRNWASLRLTISLSMAVCALFFSVFTSYVPNVILLDKESGAEIAENHKFFLRGFTSEDENRNDGVIIRQDPPLGGGILGSNLVFVCRLPHAVLSFLPFPIWKTLKYEMGDTPVIKVTGLQKGHANSREDIIPVENNEDRRSVGQFTRIYGTFENLPEDNEQLFLRVLVRPAVSINPTLDKLLLERWYVQPHEPYRHGSRFRDPAELRLNYNNGSSRDGIWYADGFFGAPQSTELPFEILAMITWKDFRRGQKYTSEEIEDIQNRLDSAARSSTEVILMVRRE
jgi:hypothetical protein